VTATDLRYFTQEEVQGSTVIELTEDTDGDHGQG
jgi:hypothetical protein